MSSTRSIIWSHDETNLLKEFLHVDRLGGQFDGPVEEATWEKIVANMNIVGTTRDIALRTYTVRDVAWQYISMIWPLLNAKNPYVAPDTNPWTLDEDDLLLHYFPSKNPGGRLEGTTRQVSFAEVATRMNTIGPMLGFHWRVYKGPTVASRYQSVIYPRFTGHPYERKTHSWKADETEFLLSLVGVKQGGYSETDEIPIHDVIEKMNEEGKVRGWTYREYTLEGIRCRLHRIRKDRIATGQLSGQYRMPREDIDESAVVEDSSDPEDYALSDNDMDTAEG